MKNTAILYFLVALMSLFAVSCNKEQLVSAGEPDDPDCYGVYFPSQGNMENLKIHENDERYLSFTVSRMVATDAIFVPVKIVSADKEIFSVTGLKFKEDEKTAELKVTFPRAELDRKYECTLVVDDPRYASLYSVKPNYITFSFTRLKADNIFED